MSEVLKDALERWENTVTEAYEIVKTVEVVVNRQIYRLEVMKAHGTGQFKGEEWYEVEGWHYTKQNGEEALTRIQPKIPWLRVDSAELALNRAINWLVNGTI